ncbi:MAG: endonuclease/exonuclease/phosphatase family protein [Vicinamibacterales bacterium]
MSLRILSYNICRGGRGREDRIAQVIGATDADLVVLQEATSAEVVARIAARLGYAQHGARPGESLAFISRLPVAHHAWHKPRRSRHAFLEIVPVGDAFRVFGLHLSAVHAAWTERRRVRELRALVQAIGQHQHGFHMLLGDFNTLAPNEPLNVWALPARLQVLVWMSGGRIRWRTIQSILDAGYVDGFRMRHPDVQGLTFPTWSPHVRLDYAFVPTPFVSRLLSCEVVRDPATRDASDHFPLLSEIDPQ